VSAVLLALRSALGKSQPVVTTFTMRQSVRRSAALIDVIMRRTRPGRAFCAAAICLAWAGVVVVRGAADHLTETFTNWLDHPAILYSSASTIDPASELSRRLDRGEVELRSEGPSGYLRSLLNELAIPIESQLEVFSNGSLQRNLINMHNPRAIFFNDMVAVGWVRGGVIEVASQDPRRGVMFYTVGDDGRLRRRHDCFTCHYSYATVGVPGMRMASSGQFVADHRVPFENRWGGWYVTGTHGSMRHLGNADIDRLFDPLPPNDTFNWNSLGSKFDGAGYLSPYSDIVALMVFQHQMQMMNLLSRMSWEARITDYQAENRSAAADKPYPLQAAAREVVDYLLFIDEAPLLDRVRGTSGFTERFTAQGPVDRRGRSLRDFDLERRMMRYPCS
jgi:hypothetical protein